MCFECAHLNKTYTAESDATHRWTCQSCGTSDVEDHHFNVESAATCFHGTISVCQECGRRVDNGQYDITNHEATPVETDYVDNLDDKTHSIITRCPACSGLNHKTGEEKHTPDKTTKTCTKCFGAIA